MTKYELIKELEKFPSDDTKVIIMTRNMDGEPVQADIDSVDASFASKGGKQIPAAILFGREKKIAR